MIFYKTFNEDLSDKVTTKQKLEVGVDPCCYLEEEHPMEEGVANTKPLRQKQAWYVQETSRTLMNGIEIYKVESSRRQI